MILTASSASYDSSLDVKVQTKFEIVSSNLFGLRAQVLSCVPLLGLESSTIENIQSLTGSLLKSNES